MSDAGFDESTARYLLRLREMEGKEVPPRASAKDQPPAGDDVKAPGNRRGYPRYRCSGGVELKKEGSNVRTWGTFTDLSLGGCYIELQATFPPDTRMELVLDLNQIRVCTRAMVRVSYPFLGMGLAFTEMLEEDRCRLEEMVATLTPLVSQVKALTKSAPGEGEAKLRMPFVADPMAALKAVVHHFQARSELTREQFLELMQQSQTYSQF